MTDNQVLLEILEKVSRVDERTKGLPQLEERMRTVEKRQHWYSGILFVCAGLVTWVGQHVGLKDLS